jgi:hypothetical protein
MKPNSIYLFRIAAVVAVTVMLTGCTHTVKSKISILQTGSPLKGLPSKTFAFKEFKDVRGTDPYLLSGSGVHKYKLDQPVATAVAMAIRKELERNGHKCITYSTQSTPDFIIEGSVYMFSWINVGVKLTLNPVSPGKAVLVKSYQGECVTGECRNDADVGVDRALLAMVKEMSTDPELIAFLEK